MKKKYIFVLTFLCLLVGQMGYAFDGYHGDSDVINAVLDAGFNNNTDSTWFFDDNGNAFAGLDSGDVSGDYISNDGTYHNFEDEYSSITDLVGNLNEDQFRAFYGSHELPGMTIHGDNRGHIIDEGQFLADVSHSYGDKLRELGLYDRTRQNLYFAANLVNQFGNGFVYTGAVLTATGVFAEVGLPLIGVGAIAGDIATFSKHGLDLYYGTFNGQQFVIDAAFLAVGSGFDWATGEKGIHTGIYTIYAEASKEWINYMNNLQNK